MQLQYIQRKKEATVRREASPTDVKKFANKFNNAKQEEITPWKKNDVYKIVDLREYRYKNYMT